MGTLTRIQSMHIDARIKTCFLTIAWVGDRQRQSTWPCPALHKSRKYPRKQLLLQFIQITLLKHVSTYSMVSEQNLTQCRAQESVPALKYGDNESLAN